MYTVLWSGLVAYNSYENYTTVLHNETEWSYTIHVYREFHDDYLLASLDVTDCDLRPSFESTIYSGYNCEVPLNAHVLYICVSVFLRSHTHT